MRRASLAALAASALALGGCAVVRLPVKAGGTVVGTAILVTTRDARDPAAGTLAGVRH